MSRRELKEMAFFFNSRRRSQSKLRANPETSAGGMKTPLFQ
jgi:hypothetical protein